MRFLYWYAAWVCVVWVISEETQQCVCAFYAFIAVLQHPKKLQEEELRGWGKLY